MRTLRARLSLRYFLLLVGSLITLWFPALMLILGCLWLRMKIAARKPERLVLELPWTLRLMRISPWIAGLCALAAAFGLAN